MEKILRVPKEVPTHSVVPPVVEPQNPVLKPLTMNTSRRSIYPLLGIGVLVVALGVGSGWVFAKRTSAGKMRDSSAGVTSSNSVATSEEAGVNDEVAFPDTVEGILREGGIEGEGTHRLDRGMGANKDVYLTSTVINLQNFVDKKVLVRGQTISGKKAGWLMDVGKVQVIK